MTPSARLCFAVRPGGDDVPLRYTSGMLRDPTPLCCPLRGSSPAKLNTDTLVSVRAIPLTTFMGQAVVSEYSLAR